jgi:hypothetical protein
VKDDSDEMVKARTTGLIARFELVLMEDSVEQGGCKMVDCNINVINVTVHWCYERVEAVISWWLTNLGRYLLLYSGSDLNTASPRTARPKSG